MKVEKMKTLVLKKEDLNARPDLGRNWYEWAGGNVKANIECQGLNIFVSSDLDTGGGNLICERLHWQLISKPIVGGRMTIKKFICPPEFQREYWKKRTGLDTEGCYAEIHKRIRSEIPRLLQRECWSETERWILESWK